MNPAPLIAVLLFVVAPVGAYLVARRVFWRWARKRIEAEDGKRGFEVEPVDRRIDGAGD